MAARAMRCGQRRYREHRGAKVTHQRREQVPPSAMVRASPATSATEAPPAIEVTAHATVHARPRPRRACCALCGVVGRFVRHETLARTGRPEQHRRLRRCDQRHEAAAAR
jgi:hypothetical protein